MKVKKEKKSKNSTKKFNDYLYQMANSTFFSPRKKSLI